jgi:hemerythrin-like domain-containing protein
MSSDAIVLLKADHKEIRRLFREFRAAGDRAVKKKGRLANQIIQALTAKVTVLMENVTHHIEEEEQEWFPQVRARLSRTQLRDIGARLEQAREKAPRTPAQPSALKKTLDAVIS